MNAWYLPVDSIGGAAASFSLAGIFKRGGSLLFGATWSLDAGDGLDDKCVFVSTEGEVAVYEGTNPGSAATWSKVGVYRIGKPLGINGYMQAGGDLLIATDAGLVPLSQAISKDVAALSMTGVSRPIYPAWNKGVQERQELPWEILKWTTRSMMVISQPRDDNTLDAECFAALQKSGYATDPNYANSVGSIARSISMPTQTASLQPITGGGGVPEDSRAALAQALMARQNGGAGQQAIAQAAPQMQPQPAPQPEQQQMAQTQPQGDQGMRAAMQALSNPYLTDGQRMVVQTLLDRQLQSMDPMRKLQMEKLQREISQPVKRDTVTINGRLVDAQTGQEIANFPAAPKAPTVQTIYDPQTGMEKKVQWVDGAWQEVGGVKAPSGTQLRVNPETGEVTFQQGAGLKPLTEGQSKDTVYATRAEGSLPVLNQLDTALTNFGESAGAKMPLIGNYLKSEDYQKAEQAGLEFLQAVLRKDTGAAITADEQDQYGNVYLPRPGDTPGVIAQKRDSRNRALEAIKAGMPPAAILAQEQALRKTGDAPAGQSPAQPGQIDTSGALEKAKAAIAAGAPREAVIKRLMDAGIDPGGL